MTARMVQRLVEVDYPKLEDSIPEKVLNTYILLEFEKAEKQMTAKRILDYFSSI